MLTHLSELVVAVITMLGSLLTIYLKHMLDEKSKQKLDPIRLNHEHDELLYAKLTEVLQKLDCDRAYLIQYHNGSHYKSGQSMLKMSMTHEVTANGISKEINGAQNLPLSMFSKSFTLFFQEGCVVIPSVDTCALDDATVELYKGRGVKSSYSFPVKDLQGRFIGALSVNFVTEEFALNDNQLQYIEATASQLSGYMRNALLRG